MSIEAGIGSKTSIGDLIMMGSTPEGLQRLKSIANGPPNPAYPGYLVVAALEKIKGIRDATMQPQPQGTVKDQLLASLQPKPMPTPPSAMGIGAMAQQPQLPAQPAPQGPPQAPPPVQGMAEGGSVQHFAEGSVKPIGLKNEVDPQTEEDRALVRSLSSKVGSGVMDFATTPYRLLAKLANEGLIRPANALGASLPRVPVSESWTPYGDETQRNLADPAKRKVSGYVDNEINGNVVKGPLVSGTYRDEGFNKPYVPSDTSPDAQAAARIGASASQRGIGPFDPKLGVASGEIKPEKFERMKDSPVNQALIDAAEKFGKPDEARMKELRAAEENAGLAAFGAGMIKPGGSFGGVFAGAARDYVNAKETKAEKRREYEDNRELMAVKLKIAVGDEKAKKFWAETEYNDKRSDKAFERASKVTETGNNAVHINNQATLELAKLKLMQEKNALEAAMLKEGKSQANQAKLEKVYLMAHEIAIKDAESIYGKTEDTSGVLNPTKAADKQRHIENKTTQMLGDLTKYFGLPGAGSASPSTSPLRANYAK